MIDVALAFHGSRFGRYPYETLTVVDPAADSLARRLGGGMEYPTLITCGTRCLLHRKTRRSAPGWGWQRHCWEMPRRR